MAFNIETDFKEVGGPDNTDQGGQTYSVFSKTDNINAMLAVGYLNALASKLNVGDTVMLSGTNGSLVTGVTVVTTAGVVTIKNLAGDADVIAAAGAISVDTYLTEIQSAGVIALTLPNGYEGQTKAITMVIDGGTATLIPDNRVGYSTIPFDDIGDGVILVMTSAGWSIAGIRGITTT